MKVKYIHTIFAAIVLLLAIEYVAIGEGLSVFRLLILPLSIVGLIFLKDKELKRNSAILSYGLLFYFVWIIGSNYFIGNAQDSVTYVLIVIFSFFLIKYFSSYPEKLRSIYKYTYWYALPHEIVYLLILAGVLSMSDYSMNFSVRFIGFHRDPNFMTIFISIAILSKIQYLKSGGSSLFLKILTACTLALDIWLVILGMSRGGILCLLVCVFLQLLSLTPQWNKKLIVASAVAVVLASSFIYVKQFNDIPGTYQSPAENMVARFNQDDFSEGSGRSEIWKKNMHDIMMFSLTPLGSALEDRPNEMYAHNTYIDILLTSGLIFGIAFIVFLVISQVKAIIDILRYGEAVNYLILALVVVSQLFFLSLLTLKLTWFFFIILLYHLLNKVEPAENE